MLGWLTWMQQTLRRGFQRRSIDHSWLPEAAAGSCPGSADPLESTSRACCEWFLVTFWWDLKLFIHISPTESRSSMAQWSKTTGIKICAINAIMIDSWSTNSAYWRCSEHPWYPTHTNKQLYAVVLVVHSGRRAEASKVLYWGQVRWQDSVSTKRNRLQPHRYASLQVIWNPLCKR